MLPANLTNLSTNPMPILFYVFHRFLKTNKSLHEFHLNMNMNGLNVIVKSPLNLLWIETILWNLFQFGNFEMSHKNRQEPITRINCIHHKTSPDSILFDYHFSRYHNSLPEYKKWTTNFCEHFSILCHCNITFVVHLATPRPQKRFHRDCKRCFMSGQWINNMNNEWLVI